jgi:mannose-1-phosphate guanylyltransferase
MKSFPPMRGMMLTAGLGTRLRPLTERFAKPAVPFLGIPLLKYPLWLMRAAGVSELVLNSHWKPEQISALATEITSADLRVHVSHEEGTPLGSGGGIWKARSWLDQRASGDNESFLVCNGDEVILPHDTSILEKFKSEHSASSALATILVMKHPLVGTQFGGVWSSPEGDVRGFGKNPAKFGSDSIGYHYIGMLLLSPRVFDYLPQGESNILYDALKAAIAAKEKVRVVVSEFTWFETGNPKDFLQATDDALHLLHCVNKSASFADSPLKDAGIRRAAQSLKEITAAYWPLGMTFAKHGDALVLKDASAKIAPSASFKGFAVLEKGAHVTSAVENIIAMPGADVSTPRKNEICL